MGISSPVPKLWCLHGNLQTEAVWQPFSNAFTLPAYPDERTAPRLKLRTVDLWSDRPSDIDAWVHGFCHRVLNECGGTRQFLLGYSLGGRLALHAAAAKPDLWRGVIAVAAHPGIKDPIARRRRLEADRSWGNRFLSESWCAVMAGWNAQPVFRGGTKPETPADGAIDRESVFHWFDRCSTGRQRHLTPDLEALAQPPILYITGSEDINYCEFGRKLAASCPCLTHRIVPGTGHRVPWEDSHGFCKAVQSFISEIR